MLNKISIAIDAMGGDNSPEKTIEGVNFFKKNRDKNDFVLNLFGDEHKIKKEIKKFNVDTKFLNIIHTASVVSDDETPLTAIKIQKIQVCGIV